MEIVFNSPVKEALQRALSPLVGTADDLYLVCAEYNPTKYSYYSSFGGLEIAKEFAQDPNKMVILMSFMNEKSLFSSHPEMAGILSFKNVAFLRLPPKLADFIQIYHMLQKGEKKEDPIGVLAFESDMLDRTVSILRHDIYRAEHEEEEMKQWLERATQAGFKGTLEEIKEAVQNWKRTTPGRFEGKILDGIFVDFQDTLVVNSQLNQKVLDLIEKLKGDKSVCIISDSDLNDVSRKLKRLNISYPIMSKFELKGASLTVVIDNISQVEFQREYGIIPMTLFQV